MCPLARTCKIAYAHWRNTDLIRFHYRPPWERPSQISAKNLCCIRYTGTQAGGWTPTTPWAEKHCRKFDNTCNIPSDAKKEGLQFTDIQTACSRWLREFHTQVWYNRFLQYWNSEYMCTRVGLLYLHSEQGELEHRTSKARYRRTDRKQFVKQMTGIERCEARTRHIRNVNKLSPPSAIVQEAVAATPDAHFHIGKSQNFPENLLNFLHKHSDDPAIKVSRISLDTVPLTLSKNRASFPSLNVFYSLKCRSFWFKRINLIWGVIRNPSPVQAQILGNNEFTSQAIGFISIIWCDSTTRHTTSAGHKTLSTHRRLTATSCSWLIRFLVIWPLFHPIHTYMPEYLAFFTLMPHTLDLTSLTIFHTGSIFSGFAGINTWKKVLAGMRRLLIVFPSSLWRTKALLALSILTMSFAGAISFHSFRVACVIWTAPESLAVLKTP